MENLAVRTSLYLLSLLNSQEARFSLEHRKSSNNDCDQYLEDHCLSCSSTDLWKDQEYYYMRSSLICATVKCSAFRTGCRVTETGEPLPPLKIKIVMACLRTILKDESQTVCNNSMHSSGPTRPWLNPSTPFMSLNKKWIKNFYWRSHQMVQLVGPSKNVTDWLTY